MIDLPKKATTHVTGRHHSVKYAGILQAAKESAVGALYNIVAYSVRPSSIVVTGIFGHKNNYTPCRLSCWHA